MSKDLLAHSFKLLISIGFLLVIAGSVGASSHPDDPTMTGGFHHVGDFTVDGNVGIGTAAPVAELHVEKSQNGATEIKVINPLYGTNSVSVVSVGTGVPSEGGAISFTPVSFTTFAGFANFVDVAAFSNTNGLMLRTSANFGIIKFVTKLDQERMRIAADGKVGIGTEKPAFSLDVAGSVHASSFPVSSDARLKTNVRQLTNVLEKLEQIRGVSFEWNELYESLGRSTGHREIGVIAQEVEAVFPELVTTWGDENYRAVDYGRLTGILIEAVKTLNVENKELQSSNATLQNQVEALLERLEDLERAVEELKQN